MSEHALLEILPGLITALTIVLLVGMFLCYRILKLVFGGKAEAKGRGKQKNGARMTDAERRDIDQLLRRCSELSQRLVVLEEIMSDNGKDLKDDPLTRQKTSV